MCDAADGACRLLERQLFLRPTLLRFPPSAVTSTAGGRVTLFVGSSAAGATCAAIAAVREEQRLASRGRGPFIFVPAVAARDTCYWRLLAAALERELARERGRRGSAASAAAAAAAAAEPPTEAGVAAAGSAAAGSAAAGSAAAGTAAAGSAAAVSHYRLLHAQIRRLLSAFAEAGAAPYVLIERIEALAAARRQSVLYDLLTFALDPAIRLNLYFLAYRIDVPALLEKRVLSRFRATTLFLAVAAEGVGASRGGGAAGSHQVAPPLKDLLRERFSAVDFRAGAVTVAPHFVEEFCATQADAVAAAAFASPLAEAHLARRLLRAAAGAGVLQAAAAAAEAPRTPRSRRKRRPQPPPQLSPSPPCKRTPGKTTRTPTPPGAAARPPTAFAAATLSCDEFPGIDPWADFHDNFVRTCATGELALLVALAKLQRHGAALSAARDFAAVAAAVKQTLRGDDFSRVHTSDQGWAAVLRILLETGLVTAAAKGRGGDGGAFYTYPLHRRLTERLLNRRRNCPLWAVIT